MPVPEANTPFIEMPSEGSLFGGQPIVFKMEGEKNAPLLSLNYENDVPQSFPFDTYEAYKIRLTSFANGAIYAIKYDTISAEEKTAKIAAIKKLMEDKLQELAALKQEQNGKTAILSSKLYQFYSKELPEASGLAPKQIALGEAMYVWQEMPRPQRITSYQRLVDDKDLTKGKLLIEQIETPRSSPLTAEQKKELSTIYDPLSPPQWFKELKPWAQAALKEIVPKPPQDDWSKYEKCHPTILRHIPGEANATQHELIIKHVKANGEQEILSHTIAHRQGAPTSFDMKNEQERQSSANETLKQMLDAEIEKAKKRFEEEWEIKLGAPVTLMPILLGGLLSPAEQAGLLGKFIDTTNLSGYQNNTRMTREKEAAAAQYNTLLANDPSVKLFNLNVSIDAMRNSTAIKPDQDFIDFSKAFSNRMKLYSINKAVPAEREAMDKRCSGIQLPLSKIEKNLTKLHSAINALEELKTLKSNDPSLKGRNQNLYTAALYDVMTRSMGGLSTGNCKSSKDRKGIEFMMADAMEIYFNEQIAKGEPPELPKFTDKKPNRKRFVEIFCELYASGHQLLVAHDNSPGCPGIKAGNTLDADIVQALKEREAYTPPKQLADFNKPGSFWEKNRPSLLNPRTFSRKKTSQAAQEGEAVDHPPAYQTVEAITEQLFALKKPAERRLGQLLAATSSPLSPAEIQILNAYIRLKKGDSPYLATEKKQQIYNLVQNIKDKLNLASNQLAVDQIYEIKSAIEKAQKDPGLLKKLSRALDTFEKNLGLVVVNTSPSRESPISTLETIKNIIADTRTILPAPAAVAGPLPPALSLDEEKLFAKLELRQALLERREAKDENIKNLVDGDTQKLKAAYELMLPSVTKKVDDNFIDLVTKQMSDLKELDDTYPDLKKELIAKKQAIRAELEKRKKYSNLQDEDKINELLDVSIGLAENKEDEPLNEKKQTPDEKAALAMLELRQCMIEQRMPSLNLLVEDEDLDKNASLSEKTKTSYKELLSEYSRSRTENFDLVEYSKKVGHYIIGKKNIFTEPEDPLKNAEAQKEITLKILGEAGYRILHPTIGNVNQATAPAPTTARMRYLQYLQSALDAHHERGKKTQLITMEQLLGKQGKDLYKAAIREEMTDPAFRNAVFLKSVENFRGPRWKQKLVLWIAGPSSAGKTFATNGMIEKIAKWVMPKIGDAEVDNYVVTIDGAVQREVSQIRKLTVDTAIDLGYRGVKDVDKGVNGKLKGEIERAAQANDTLSVAIPDTFTKYMIRAAKKLGKLFSKNANKENVLHIYSQVKCGEGREAENTFSLSVGRMGESRAFLKTGKDHYSISIDGKTIIESKKYDRGFLGINFRKGQELARLGKHVYHRMQGKFGKPTHTFDVIHDLIFITFDKDKKIWRECHPSDGDGIRMTTRRAWKAWQADSKSTITVNPYEQLDTWLKNEEGGAKPTLKDPIIHYYYNGMKKDHQTEMLLIELEKLKESLEASLQNLPPNQESILTTGRLEKLSFYIAMIKKSQNDNDPINKWRDHQADIELLKNDNTFKIDYHYDMAKKTKELYYNIVPVEEKINTLLQHENSGDKAAEIVIAFLTALKNQWNIEAEIVAENAKEQNIPYEETRRDLLSKTILELQKPSQNFDSIQTCCNNLISALQALDSPGEEGDLSNNSGLNLVPGTQFGVRSLTHISTQFLEEIKIQEKANEIFAKAIQTKEDDLVANNTKSFLISLQEQWTNFGKGNNILPHEKSANEDRLKELAETIKKISQADISLQDIHLEINRLKSFLSSQKGIKSIKFSQQINKAEALLEKLQINCLEPLLYKAWLEKSSSANGDEVKINSNTFSLLDLGRYVADMIEQEVKDNSKVTITEQLRNPRNYVGNSDEKNQKFIHQCLVQSQNSEKFTPFLLQHAEAVRKNKQAQIQSETPHNIIENAGKAGTEQKVYVAGKIIEYLETIKAEWAAKEIIMGVSNKESYVQNRKNILEASIAELKKIPSPDFEDMKNILNKLGDNLQNISYSSAGLAQRTFIVSTRSQRGKKLPDLKSQTSNHALSIKETSGKYVANFIEHLKAEEKFQEDMKSYEAKIKDNETRREFVEGKEANNIKGSATILRSFIQDVRTQQPLWVKRHLRNDPYFRVDNGESSGPYKAEPVNLIGWEYHAPEEIKEEVSAQAAPNLAANPQECRGLPNGMYIEYKNTVTNATIRESHQNSYVQISAPQEPPTYNTLTVEEKQKIDIDIAEAMVRLWVARCGTPVPISDTAKEGRMRALIVVCEAHGLKYQLPLFSQHNYKFLTDRQILMTEIQELEGQIGENKKRQPITAPRIENINELEADFVKLKNHYENELKGKFPSQEEQDKCEKEINVLSTLLTEAKNGKLSAKAANDAIIHLSESLKGIEIAEPVRRASLQ